MTKQQKDIITAMKSNGFNISDAIKKNSCSLDDYYSFLDNSDFAAGIAEARQYADDYARTQFMKLIQQGDRTAIIEYHKRMDKEAEEDNNLAMVGLSCLEAPTALLPAQYEAHADMFIDEVRRNSKTIGNGLAGVDNIYLDTVRDNYRDYIDLREQVRGNYTEIGKFGKREHHLFKAYHTARRIHKNDLKELGLTPKSRQIMDIVPTSKVPHGNAKSTSIMDIINE